MSFAKPMWHKIFPGDAVLLSPYTSLEAITTDCSFNTGHKTVYCLCIGRVERRTHNGLRNVQFVIMTPSGVGSKRISLSDQPTVEPTDFSRTWES